MKKLNDPLLLAPKSGPKLENAADPGGFGYDSAAKCEHLSCVQDV